ncbi:MAG TPA: hypothetical protein VLE95_04870 [Chlamydiales bacterium]|nr:hypothetical protein [Chlamydiales bacterium]
MSAITKEYVIGAFLGGAAFALMERILSPLIRKIVELIQSAWYSISNPESSNNYQIKNPSIIKTGVKNELV